MPGANASPQFGMAQGVEPPLRVPFAAKISFLPVFDLIIIQVFSTVTNIEGVSLNKSIQSIKKCLLPFYCVDIH